MNPSFAGTPFSMEALKKIISDNNVTTIEQLLPLLPQELRSNYTLVYDSQSPLQNGDRVNPRAILFGKSGKFILTFNGGGKDPAVAGGNEIEVMQFNGKSFEMYELVFEKNKPVKGFENKNPAKCLACHHSNPRPIWTSYKEWPGVYGGFDDYVSNFSDDKQSYLTFKKAAASHPRYRALDSGDTETFPYREEIGSDNFKNRPNLRLSKLLVQLNGERLIALLRKSPAYPKMRAQMLFTMYGCGDKSRPEMESLIQKTGVPLAEWSLNKDGSANNQTEDKYVDPDGMNARIFFEGSAGIERYVARGVLEDLGKDFPKIKTYFKELDDKQAYPVMASYSGYEANSAPLAPAGASKPFDLAPKETCDELSKLIEKEKQSDFIATVKPGPSLISIKAENCNSQGSIITPVIGSDLSKVDDFIKRGPEILKSRCVICHASGMSLAPQLPFGNEAALIQKLKSTPSFLDKILGRISGVTPQEDRMPPDGAEFSSEDRSSLEFYLKSIAHDAAIK